MDPISNRELIEGLGKSYKEFKAERLNAKNQVRNLRRIQAKELKEKGWSNAAIGRILGISTWVVNSVLED